MSAGLYVIWIRLAAPPRRIGPRSLAYEHLARPCHVGREQPAAPRRVVMAAGGLTRAALRRARSPRWRRACPGCRLPKRTIAPAGFLSGRTPRTPRSSPCRGRDARACGFEAHGVDEGIEVIDDAMVKPVELPLQPATAPATRHTGPELSQRVSALGSAAPRRGHTIR
jgi:hypothetical protein